jgi:hypothetical protein
MRACPITTIDEAHVFMRVGAGRNWQTGAAPFGEPVLESSGRVAVTLQLPNRVVRSQRRSDRLPLGRVLQALTKLRERGRDRAQQRRPGFLGLLSRMTNPERAAGYLVI